MWSHPVVLRVGVSLIDYFPDAISFLGPGGWQSILREYPSNYAHVSISSGTLDWMMPWWQVSSGRGLMALQLGVPGLDQRLEFIAPTFRA